MSSSSSARTWLGCLSLLRQQIFSWNRLSGAPAADQQMPDGFPALPAPTICSRTPQRSSAETCQRAAAGRGARFRVRGLLSQRNSGNFFPCCESERRQSLTAFWVGVRGHQHEPPPKVETDFYRLRIVSKFELVSLRFPHKARPLVPRQDADLSRWQDRVGERLNDE